MLFVLDNVGDLIINLLHPPRRRLHRSSPVPGTAMHLHLHWLWRRISRCRCKCLGSWLAEQPPEAGGCVVLIVPDITYVNFRDICMEPM